MTSEMDVDEVREPVAANQDATAAQEDTGPTAEPGPDQPSAPAEDDTAPAEAGDDATPDNEGDAAEPEMVSSWMPTQYMPLGLPSKLWGRPSTRMIW